MRIRELEIKDAPYMLEWMHDETVVKDLKTEFLSKTLSDCENFIRESRDTMESIHWAIVDENDEYMGTVSLKNIDGDTAEFGIAIRKKAMGKGYAHYAMSEMIQYGYDFLRLSLIYWCVNPCNMRAVRFYEKHGYKRIMAPDAAKAYTEDEKKEYIWYTA